MCWVSKGGSFIGTFFNDIFTFRHTPNTNTAKILIKHNILYLQFESGITFGHIDLVLNHVVLNFVIIDTQPE